MRQISSQLTWILIAVLASVAATNAQSKPAFEPPTVRYCDLVSNPDAYDGKQIRLRAEYESSFEASVFADSKCVKRWDPKKLIWVEFDDATFSKTAATTLKQFEDARYRPETDKDGRITSRWWSWRVKLAVVGVFQKAKDSDYGFGHQGVYPYMLTISKIDSVGKLKKLPPPYKNAGA